MGQLLGISSEEGLRLIRRSWPNRGWTWDERSGCVASSFPADSQSEYEAILVQIFATRWDHRTISKAPPPVSRIAERTGGIRAGQMLFAPKDCSDVFPYALWWPWGDDTTVSVRIALAPDGRSARASVREVFGVDSDL